jgi:hypothetical protein
MSDEPKKRRPRWGWGIRILIAVSVLVGYALSIAPAWSLVRAVDPKHEGWSSAAFSAFYAPLHFAVRLTKTDYTYAWYLSHADCDWILGNDSDT